MDKKFLVVGDTVSCAPCATFKERMKSVDENYGEIVEEIDRSKDGKKFALVASILGVKSIPAVFEFVGREYKRIDQVKIIKYLKDRKSNGNN